MNLSTNVAVTAVLLLVLSGGLLLPVHNSITALEESISELEATTSSDSDIPARLEAVNEDLESVRDSMARREFVLCPNTPEARHEFETALHREIQMAGLARVSMDRQAGFGTGDVPSFVISLVVEGDAFQFHQFLRGVESLQWVTRVLKLEVQPGDTLRRIKMQIAVLLEDAS